MGLHRQQQELYDLLRSVSGQRQIIAIPRILVRLCGGYEEAAMLSQILYWSHPNTTEGWFYKTLYDWAAELEITEKQVRRAKTNLELLAFIETKLMRTGNSPVTWYRPAPEAIITALENCVEVVDKHLPEWAAGVPQRAAGAARGGKSSIPQDYTQDARARARGGRELGKPPTSEQLAQFEFEWAELENTPFGQFLSGQGLI